jgi:hypothetical protein
MSVDRRDFVAMTLGVAAAGNVSIAGAAPWRDALIINALGDLDDPNPPAGGEKPGQRPALPGSE